MKGDEIGSLISAINRIGDIIIIWNFLWFLFIGGTIWSIERFLKELGGEEEKNEE